MNTETALSTAEDLSPDSIEPIVREILIIVALVALLGIASLLPGTGIELPGTTISIGDLIIAGASLGIVASLIWVGPKLRTVAERVLIGPPRVLSDVGSIARNLALFTAVLVAHWGFEPVLRPLLEIGWLYDAGFLVLALIPLGIVAYRVYTSLDPLTTFLTDRLLGTQSQNGTPTEENDWS
ncbi:MAG: hypothetical protein ABEH64_14185 [Salinirussus sp.]